MGSLTDTITAEIEYYLDILFEAIEQYPEDTPRSINVPQFGGIWGDCTLERNSKLTRSQLERLSFYSPKKEIDLASRFHTILLAKENVQPYEFRDFMYVPSDSLRAQEVLGNALSELIIEIDDSPEDFRPKEKYLYVVQKLAPINFPVSQGYMDFFNLQHKIEKEIVDGWIYQIEDTSGQDRYGITKERK